MEQDTEIRNIEIESIQTENSDKKDKDSIEESIKFNFVDGNTGTEWVFFSLAAKEVGLSDKQFERNCDKYGLPRVKMKSAHVDNRQRNYISREDLDKYKKIKEQEEYEKSLMRSRKSTELVDTKNNQFFSTITNIENQLSTLVTDRKSLVSLLNDIHSLCSTNNDVLDKQTSLIEEKENLLRKYEKSQEHSIRWKKRGMSYLVLICLFFGGFAYILFEYNTVFIEQNLQTKQLIKEKESLIKAYEKSILVNNEYNLKLQNKDQIIKQQEAHLDTNAKLLNNLSQEMKSLKDTIITKEEASSDKSKKKK